MTYEEWEKRTSVLPVALDSADVDSLEKRMTSGFSCSLDCGRGVFFNHLPIQGCGVDGDGGGTRYERLDSAGALFRIRVAAKLVPSTVPNVPRQSPQRAVVCSVMK